LEKNVFLIFFRNCKDLNNWAAVRGEGNRLEISPEELVKEKLKKRKWSCLPLLARTD